MLVIAELQVPLDQKVYYLRLNLSDFFLNLLLFLFDKFDLEFGQLTFVSIVDDLIPSLVVE